VILAVSIVAIISAVGIYALNPAGLIAKARNSEREAHLNTIMNGIRQNLADNRNTFNCQAGGLPTSTALLMATSSGAYDIAPCLVPDYLNTMPYDPSGTSTRYASNNDYNTGYLVMRNASTGQVTLSAPQAELGQIIFLTR